MFRRVMFVLGMATLVGMFLPSTPVSAANAFSLAVITGTVVPDTGTCTMNATAKPYDDLPVGFNSGDLVTFQDVALTGVFGNYIGPITAQPVDACAHSYDLQDVVEPLDALAGWGRITAGGEFTGDFVGKCVRGKVGASATPAGGSAGDYIQVGVVAIVKFDISFTNGTLNVDNDCITKKTVTEVDCVGAITVAPIESITSVGTVGDPVAGSIVCHNALPSNKGDNR